MGEKILVVSRDTLDACGSFQGFRKYDPVQYAPLFSAQSHRFMEREEAEDDASFKQLIPYVVLIRNGKLLSYYRGTGQGEQRLHGKRSIGVGGHINPDDLMSGPYDMYTHGMRRELLEELNFSKWDPSRIRRIGLINDDSTDVGKVHFGVVEAFLLPGECTVEAREKDMLDVSWHYRAELLKCVDEFESWSQFCLDEPLLTLATLEGIKA